MASAMAERIELAKLCSSKDWSKAIRVLDSLLSQFCAIQDLCNRAFCYSQLELHKHVVKDCDKALQLDPKLVQAYILKGRAFSALGRKEEALLVWEQGYKHAVCQSADLKQLMELEDLVRVAKQNGSMSCQSCVMESSGSSFSASESVVSKKSSDESNNHGKSNGTTTATSSSPQQVEAHEKLEDNSSLDVKGDSSFGSLSNTKHENHPIETNGIHKKSVGKFALCDSSESSSELIDFSDICSEPLSLSEIHNELMDESNRSKKFCVARISKNKSINVDFRLSRGIAQVNEGKYAYAISIFDKILQEEPDYPEALIGRGTAYAFQRELHAAIADFTKAIQSNPSAGEAWKRRGQARAALGESAKAIADLTKALEFEPNSPDILHERGIVNFKFKDYKAAVEDLSACVEVDDQNKSAYTYLGQALSSLGEYRRAEEAHMKAIQIDQSFLEAWTHLTQFYQDMANSEKALRCIHEILKIDDRFAKAYHLHGLLLHGMGEHRNAIKELSMGLSIDNSNIECLYLRASCYHAIGEFKEAVKDYDAALDLELDSMEKFVLQCLAFYQKEIVLYTASKFNTEFSWFDLDGDIDPLFKEYWCKRLHPKNVCEKVYRQPPLRDSVRKGKLKKQEFSLTKQKAALLHAADSIGKKIQYHCPGFLLNKRQHRMAGLAALEIAQKVVKVWRSLQTEWKHSNKGALKHGKKIRRKEKLNPPTSQNRGGAGCSTSSLLESSTAYNAAEDKSYGRPSLPWHGVYSLAVKWRQISEPCDPVVWINKLSEEFNSGFGSHTPLILGQAKVVRYFPEFQRTFNVAKALMKENKYVRDKKDNMIYLNEDGKLQEIRNAESCSDLYRAVGQDFWLATWCHSMAVEGKQLEGTRISLIETDPIGYDFAIKTPCTSSRWDDFEMEMTSAWETICEAYCGENYGSTDFDVLENVREAILRMTYYWYNFMPLSRGTAVIGLIVLLGLLLAANMEFTGTIPEGVQVDWEAILERDPNSFISSVKSWLYPSLKINTSWKGHPDVASTLETTGLVVAALSTYSD
ncbi:Tetratricopeptide repeat superfamily protein [Perilla frutescens var. hirtella]|uniref:Tetratricopeptide repeat superfamily protein n=1 Tax=Perilla frutescens var. hirtella TaxID=608512 RepID=A0AAD4PF68_PERFH|nr:Tetratricopeptide repeat superfamily protein [Perilla frutescens var. hirtella]